MNRRGKTPVSLSGLREATAQVLPDGPRLTAHRVRFWLDFQHGTGPAIAGDGRALIVYLESAELANVLDRYPAGRLDTGTLLALTAVTSMLKGEPARFTGARLDDLRAVTELANAAAENASTRQRRALARVRECCGTPGKA